MDGNYTGAEHTYIYSTLENIANPAITARYSLPAQVKEELLQAPSPFSTAYAECVYLRTYSRKKPDGSKECWADTVIRVIEGTMEAYLTHFKKNGLAVDMIKLNDFASEMARSLFKREWCPPGRGLYAMGTDHTRQNGNAALNNCYACETKNIVLAASWAMDMLMCGGGVGFDCSWDGVITAPDKSKTFTFAIPDTRQGWVAALEVLLRAYIPIDGVITNEFPIFDYSLIRPGGVPLKGFGGTSSGPEPLRVLLNRAEIFLDTYLAYNSEEEDKKAVFRTLLERMKERNVYPCADFEKEKADLEQALATTEKTYGRSRLVVDLFNSIGACVVAGSIRRCLPGDALVSCRDGLKRIADIAVGDEVLTADGYRKVTEHLIQGQQELVKIVTTDGEFRCTANHQMAVSKGSSYIWKQASELTSKDYLVISRVPIEGRNTVLPITEGLTIPQLDIDSAWLIGLLQVCAEIDPRYKRDGQGASLKVTLSADQEEFNNKVHQQLLRFDSNVTIKRRKNKKYFVICSKNKELVWYFEQNFTQRVPECLLEAELEIRLAYIAGIIDGDGWTNKNSLVINTSNYSWAKHIQTLCYSCGFETRLKIQENPRSKAATNYKLTLVSNRSKFINSHKSIFKRISRISFDDISIGDEIDSSEVEEKDNWDAIVDSKVVSACPYLFEKTLTGSKLYPVRVLEVVADVVEETYDISVEDRHEFFCDGYLTHNSAELSLSDPEDVEFIDLKNADVNPERKPIMWMSNNSIRLWKHEDFEKMIPEVAKRVKRAGEPGLINMINVRKYGRYGDTDYGEDKATLVNPCVTGDTLVMTSNGLQRVDQLIGTTFTAVVDGEEHFSFKGFWESGEKETFLLTLTNGMSLTATADHKILTKNNSWVELKDLTDDDEIVLSDNRGYGCEGEKGWEEGYLLGGVIANEITTKNRVTSLDLTNLDHWYMCGVIAGIKDKLNFFQDDSGRVRIVAPSDVLSYLQLLLAATGIIASIDGDTITCEMGHSKQVFSSKIRSIEAVGIRKVYDCTVEDVHRFSANGIMIRNCGEINLEHCEPCTLSMVCPPNCRNQAGEIDLNTSLKAVGYATFYASTVTLIRHHWPITNAVIARNRRIGVSVGGITNIYSEKNFTYLTMLCRKLYKEIRRVNKELAVQAGIPPSIKVSTSQPSGTLSIILDCNAGIHFAICNYAKRRIAMAKHDPIVKCLRESGYATEDSIYDTNTVYVIFPITAEGRAMKEVSIYEQFAITSALQRCYADNSISVTIHFSTEREADEVERAIAMYIPQLKSCSLLPYSDDVSKKSEYAHMPFEEITKEEYEELLKTLRPIKWDLGGVKEVSDAAAERGCTSDKCVL